MEDRPVRKYEVRRLSKKKTTVNNLIAYGIVVIAFIIIQCLISTGSISRTLKGQLVPICVYVIMALSLNLVVGFSGELSLGHAGFMSIGTFSGVVLSGWLSNAFNMPALPRLILSLIFGGLMAAIFGFLIGIPVLRLRGDYLAIVTLAFGEIIRNLMNILYINVNNGSLIIGIDQPDLPGQQLIAGPMGTVKVEKITDFSKGGFYVGIILVLLTLMIVLNLINSRSGRAIMACRDSRIAAESVGINPTKYKMMAFVTGAALAGVAGAMFGLSQGNVMPSKFDFNNSILILVYVVLGGIGNIWGSIISATLLFMLPTILQKMNLVIFGIDFSTGYMLIYAIVLIVVMLLTNAPKIRSFFQMLFKSRKNETENGGTEA